MNAQEVIRACREEGLSLSEYALRRESAQGGLSPEEILRRFDQMLSVMETSAREALEKPVRSVSGLTGGDAYLYEQRRKTGSLLGGAVSRAVAFALSCSEVNASMGRIVACPTAGSCGIVPAAVLSVEQEYGLSREAVVRSLLTTGLVGQIIGEHACLAGAQGGCQAECGSASAMAAAAVTELLGGSPSQSFDAAAMAIKNSLGLVCDPVAGLVEIPCIKRNVIGAMNAVSCADMALVGVVGHIPADEVIDAMAEVGAAMSNDLRETGIGGLAGTPTGKAIRDIVQMQG